MKDTINRKKLFIAYSLIFAVMCPIVYYQFFCRRALLYLVLGRLEPAL